MILLTVYFFSMRLYASSVGIRNIKFATSDVHVDKPMKHEKFALRQFKD